MGIGTGRIAIDIAKFGYKVTGIDISKKMLKKVMNEARKQNVENNIKTINASISDFKVETPADFVYLPFRTFGHLMTEIERKKAFLNIKKQMSKNGVFVFDHYVFDEKWAKAHERIPLLMYSGVNKKGVGISIWDTYKYDYLNKKMECMITVEYYKKNRKMIKRYNYPLTFSWINVEEVRKLLNDTGFEIIETFGDFNGEKFNDKSTEQIWVVRPI